MKTFTIDNAALAEIKLTLRQSACEDPVAALHEIADPGNLLDDVKTALLKGNMKKEDLDAMGKERFEEVEDHLKFRLEVSAYERADCRPEDLVDVNGVTFVMVRYLRDALRDYRLTFEDERYMLRSADDVAGNLRSVKTILGQPKATKKSNQKGQIRSTKRVRFD
jgi:hypothetical protein